MKILAGGWTFLIIAVLAWGVAFGQGGPYYGHGMMGGYGYGPGYGMGPGMMGGYGYGGYGMGPGMGGYGPGYGPGWRGYDQKGSEACQKFLDDTASMRRELHNKRYDYFEAMRDPKMKAEDLAKQEKELNDLQAKIYEKNPGGCWW